MANALYGLGRQGFLDGTIDWDTDDIKLIVADDTDYTVSIDVDQYVNKDTIPDAARVTNGISGNFASKTVALGVADAADITLTTVTGEEFECIVIGKDGGDAFASQSGTNDLLIAYIDTATGLPCTPNGGDITIAWDAGANKIFKL
jgi:hypothetical protein